MAGRYPPELTLELGVQLLTHYAFSTCECGPMGSHIMALFDVSGFHRNVLTIHTYINV